MSFKKWSFWLVALIMVGSILSGCGSSEDTNEEPTDNSSQTEESEGSSEAEENEIVITISQNEGEEILEEKTVAIEDGAILMEVMEENFDLETEFDGEFIAKIDGVGPEDGEEVAWMYNVNGQTPSVGASEYELEAGDEVVFDLQPW